MGVYEKLGVRKVINACSTATHLGGSIPDPRMMVAMAEAAEQYVIMMELQDRAGEVIAKATGAETAMVTSGATSCARGCTAEELEESISERTAAVAFSAHRERHGVPLEKVVEVAHRKDVPVIVDAVMAVLPRSRLGMYASMGVDLVAISGGKQMRGPNDTGILCGRRGLVEMAKLQASLFNGLGRGMKVDRTQIIGLLKALEIYLGKTPEEEEAEFREWCMRAEWIVEPMRLVGGVESAKISDSEPWEVRAMIAFDEGVSARGLAFSLREGDPSIWVETSMTGDDSDNRIGIAVDSFQKGEEEVIVSAIQETLQGEVS
jgi:seryl-tRNA(Sec) selenium transferase